MSNKAAPAESSGVKTAIQTQANTAVKEKPAIAPVPTMNGEVKDESKVTDVDCGHKIVKKSKSMLAGTKGKSERKDRYGSVIVSNKKHKVCFRDSIQPGQAVADIKMVESYKEYNVLKEEGGCGCGCLLF